MGKKKKVAVLITGGMLIVIVGMFIIVSVMGKKREIDQKILFIYRYHYMGMGGRYFTNKGYFIDSQGRQIEYDFTRSLESHEEGPNDNEMLEMLEEAELAEGEVIFSEREVQKLYDWLNKIDVGCEIKMEHAPYYMSAFYEVGVYELLGIRYKEDGTAEIIRLFDVGCYNVENRDPYALKIRKVLLEKNPIAYWLEIIINGGRVSLYLQGRLFV